MSHSTVSRRISEFLGVALFAVALIWLISLVTWDAKDPVWFFTTHVSNAAPENFVGRVGAFLSELSFQLFGYGAYLIPLLIGVIGWHYFWCQVPDAAYTKVTGVTLLFACTSAFLSLVFGSADTGGRPFDAGGTVGAALAGVSTDYLNRTGSIIVLLTLMMLAVILSTQFSFGRMFEGVSESGRQQLAAGAAWLKDWRDKRRQDKARRAVAAKHTKKGAAVTAAVAAVAAAVQGKPAKPGADAAAAAKPLRAARAADPEAEDDEAPARPAPAVVARKRFEGDTAPPLPEPEPVRAVPRKQGAYTLPPPSLLDAPKAERKIDERELMESARHLEEKCREFSVEGQVAQIHPGPVVTTFEFKPDAGVKYSKITNLSDDLCLAMQAESVLIDRIPGKSTVGIQIPNPSREAISLREMLESEALPALCIEADARARQDDSRRALRHRPRDHAAPADRRLDRHWQVGRPELDAHQHPLPGDAR